MNRFLSFILLSILLLTGTITFIIYPFQAKDTYSIVISIIFIILFTLGALYCFLYGLSFVAGKKIKVVICDKRRFYDRGGYKLSGRYVYKYQVNINNKVRTRRFAIRAYNAEVTTFLNVGDIIEVNKLWFVTSIDVREFIANFKIPNANNLKNDEEYDFEFEDDNNSKLDEQLNQIQDLKNRTVKTEFFVVIIIVVLIAICTIVGMANQK